MIIVDLPYARAARLDAADKWDRYRRFAEETFPPLRGPRPPGCLRLLAYLLAALTVVLWAHLS